VEVGKYVHTRANTRNVHAYMHTCMRDNEMRDRGESGNEECQKSEHARHMRGASPYWLCFHPATHASPAGMHLLLLLGEHAVVLSLEPEGCKAAVIRGEMGGRLSQVIPTEVSCVHMDAVVVNGTECGACAVPTKGTAPFLTGAAQHCAQSHAHAACRRTT
jgi:hypothetical protein